MEIPFSKVRRAREALREKAEELVDLYMKNIENATVAGDAEVAGKAIQWALEHLADDDGTTVVSPGVDKPRPVEQVKGPSIQIGFALGGLSTQLALPSSEAVDAETVEEPSEDPLPTNPKG